MQVNNLNAPFNCFEQRFEIRSKCSFEPLVRIYLIYVASKRAFVHSHVYEEEFARSCIYSCICVHCRIQQPHTSAERYSREAHSRIGMLCRTFPVTSLHYLSCNSIYPENPNILSGLSTLYLIHEIP